MAGRIVHKVHGEVVACCDESLVGKVLKGRGLAVRVESKFYGKERVSEEALSGILAGAASANLLGENAVAVALRMGLADEKNVKRIAGVPHLQIFGV